MGNKIAVVIATIIISIVGLLIAAYVFIPDPARTPSTFTYYAGMPKNTAQQWLEEK